MPYFPVYLGPVPQGIVCVREYCKVPFCWPIIIIIIIVIIIIIIMVQRIPRDATFYSSYTGHKP